MAKVILPNATTTTTTPATPDHTTSITTTTTTTTRTRSPNSLKNTPTPTTTPTTITNNNNNNKNNKENHNNSSNCCSNGSNNDTLQTPRSSCRRSPKKKNYMNIKDSNNSIRSNSASRNSHSSCTSSNSTGRSSCSSSSSSSSSSCSSSNSSSQGLRFHPRASSVHCAQQRRMAFSRSRSLSECRPSWPTREGERGPSEARTEAQSRFCRVRSFKSTRKGLVRDGESYKSTDTKTFMSTGSVRVYRKLSVIGRSESIDSTDSSVGGSSVAESYYRVCVLGAPGVGKSTLIRKFLTSEEHSESACNAGDTSRTRAVTVSVLLDGQESLLEFWNHSQEEAEGETVASLRPLDTSTTTLTSSNQASDDAGDDAGDDVGDDAGDDVGDDVFDSSLSQGDAYTIVFAVNDLESFRRAESFLRHLREERGTDRAITLVGNKSDLVRQRRVLNKDGCVLAHRYDCKYIETSAVLGHQTDELLVGTLRQIRLKLSTSRDQEKMDDVKASNRKYVKWQKIIHLYRFLHGASQSVDSCQNFFV